MGFLARLPVDLSSGLLLGLLLVPPAAVLLGLTYLGGRRERPTRINTIPPREERVLILGASDGIGKELSLAYARRGASVCLVARSQSKLEAVASECKELIEYAGTTDACQRMKSGGPARVLSLAVNIADVDGMLAVRQAVEDSWGGLDTVHIVAGVLSTKTFAASAGSPPKSLSTVAGVARHMNGRARSAFAPAEKAGLEAILDLARKSIETNYLGPLLSYAVFLPLLSAYSPQPTVVYLSTVAAVLPTPTRTLYSGSKGASHALLASLALESDILGLGVEFIEILAGSVNTSLRTRAVDAKGANVEPPSKYSLEPAAVATSVIEAVDQGPASSGKVEMLRLRQVWLPERPYRWAHLLYWLPGKFGRRKVEDGAREKYRAALTAQ